MTECSVFVAIGGSGISTKTAIPQQVYFARFFDQLLRSDFTRDYTLTIRGVAQSLYEARNEWIPRLAQDSELVLQADADTIVPALWWRYVKKTFADNPKLGVLVPRMTGNGFFDYCQRLELNRLDRGTWIITDEGREAYPPGSDLRVLDEDFPDQTEDVWCDAFMVIRSSMVRDIGTWGQNLKFRQQVRQRGWLYAVSYGFVVVHDKGKDCPAVWKPDGYHDKG